MIDPLAKQLACDCVAGYPQRDYGKLAQSTEAELQRPVQIAYGEALATPQIGGVETVDLVIGKFSVVMFDAKRAGQTGKGEQEMGRTGNGDKSNYWEQEKGDLQRG